MNAVPSWPYLKARERSWLLAALFIGVTLS
jgi:hypothetical protein